MCGCSPQDPLADMTTSGWALNLDGAEAADEAELVCQDSITYHAFHLMCAAMQGWCSWCKEAFRKDTFTSDDGAVIGDGSALSRHADSKG